MVNGDVIVKWRLIREKGGKGIRREGRRKGGEEREKKRVFNSIIKYTLLLKKIINN